MPAFFSGKIQLWSSWPKAVLRLMLLWSLSTSAFSVIFWNPPFQDGYVQAADIKQGAAPPSGCKQQAPHASLAEKGIGNLLWRCLSKEGIPLSFREITSHHISPSAAPRDTMQLGNQVWTHRTAAANIVLLIMLDAGFLPWACPQRLDSCTVPILDIQGSPGWYQWIWSPAQPTQMRDMVPIALAREW